MSFERCSRPAGSELAVNTHKRHGSWLYRPLIDRELAHWRGTVAEHGRRVSGGPKVINEFRLVMQSKLLPTYASSVGAGYVDADKRHRELIGGLAVSMLLRQMLDVTPSIDDGRAMGSADHVLDLNRGTDRSPGYRLHLDTRTAEGIMGEPYVNDRTWYYNGEIYVRRVQPAEPTSEIVSEASAAGVEIEFGELETLFPYVPTVR